MYLKEHLDNPFYSALSTDLSSYAAGTATVKKFFSSILPFIGAASRESNLLEKIAPFCDVDEEIVVKDLAESIPAAWHVLAELPCIQMICSSADYKPVDVTENIELLTVHDAEPLFNLVNEVQPGYFRRNTQQLGNYYGIIKDNQLVAVAGERLRFPGVIELSAVCTRKGYTGHGYAQQLSTEVCNRIFEKGCIPILHVLSTNDRAIKLYRMLGFHERMQFNLTRLKYNGNIQAE